MFNIIHFLIFLNIIVADIRFHDKEVFTTWLSIT